MLREFGLGGWSERLRVNPRGRLRLRREVRALLLLLPLVGFLTLANIAGYPAISGWDEGLYLQFAANLADHGEYATRNGATFERLAPVGGTGPTLIVPVALGLRLTDGSLVAARLVVVAYLLVALAAAYLLVRAIGGPAAAPVGLALFLAAGRPGYGTLWLGRQVLAEAPALAFLLLGLWLWVASWGTARRWRILGSVSLALAVVSKNQLIWVLIPGLGAFLAIERLYHRRLRWSDTLLPLIAVPLGYLGWFGLSYGIVGPEEWPQYLDAQRALTEATFLHGGPRRWLSNARLLLASPQGACGALAIGYCLYRGRERSLRGLRWLVLPLLGGAAALGFLVLSLPWPRYAHLPLLLGGLCVALLLGDLAGRARARPGNTGRILAPLAAVLIAGVLCGPALLRDARLIATSDDASAARFARAVERLVPVEAAVLNWEWEVEFYARRLFLHPPYELFPAMIDQVYNGRADPLLAQPRIPASAAFVITGPFADQTGLFAAALAGRSHRLLITEGPYRLYGLEPVQQGTPPPGSPPSAEQCFPQTGHCIAGAFARYWRDHGGLAQQGYPISDEFAEVSPTDGRTYTVQYFERARFELHPASAGAPAAVALGLLGREQFAAKYPQGRPPGGAGDRCFAETARCVRGAFFAYWSAHGGLAQQGYPISDEFDEVSPTDGRTYTVQYFERARFELHGAPADGSDEVLLGLLGREQYASRAANTTPLPSPPPSPPAGSPPPPAPGPSPTAAPRPSATPAPVAPPDAPDVPDRHIPVGPGFADVSPHQLVRTSGDVLYAVAATCERYPDCPASTLKVYRADRPGVPTGFIEQDPAHQPVGALTVAVAIDGADRLHVLWLDRLDGGRARFALFDTRANRWGEATTLFSPTGYLTTEGIAEGAALALDAAGRAHAAWNALGADGRLHLFFASGGDEAWGAPVQIDDAPLAEGVRSMHPTLAFTPSGELLLAWLRGSFNYVADGTIHVRARQPDGRWGASVQLPDQAMTGIDNGPAMLVTADGVAHLTYLDEGNTVRYWYDRRDGAGWRGDRQPPRQVTHNPSLGPDGHGGLYLYGHGAPPGDIGGYGRDLYRFHLPAAGSDWEPWTSYLSGAYDCSVSTRWSQFFHHSPGRVDILYWADPYPNVLYVGSE